MNLNTKQILSIVMVILGVLMASTAQLTDLFGPGTTRAIVGIAGMINSTLAGILAIFNGQASTVKDVQDMPGISKIVVNAQANSTLAALAVDEAQPKIEAAPEAARIVEQTAKG